MNSIGIVRNVDELGRIVIPKETRAILAIEQGDALEIFYDEKVIYLKKYAPGCTFCNNVTKLKLYKGLHICEQCISILSDLSESDKNTDGSVDSSK